VYTPLFGKDCSFIGFKTEVEQITVNLRMKKTVSQYILKSLNPRITAGYILNSYWARNPVNKGTDR